MNRRNILTLLGLAPIATPAISADDVTNQGPESLLPFSKGKAIQLAKYDPERMATALERLAAEVRKKDVAVCRFNISTEAVSIQGPDFLTQTLTIDLELHHDVGA